MKPLPLNDHVVRHLKKTQLLRNDEGTIVGIIPDAFRLREDEKALSVTWLEHFGADYERGLVGAANGIRNARNVYPRDGFSVATIEAIHAACASRDVKVRILHEPSKKNSGHSAMRRLPAEHQDLFDLLATDAFTDTRQADSVV